MGRPAFGTHMVYRETFFANPDASSSAPYPQELNPWSSGISEPINSSTAEKNENQTPVQDQRCQSGPSAKDSVIFFQNSTFDELTRQKFIEDQKIIMELSGRLQELKNEVNCMIDSKDFQDGESICSGNSHVTSQPGVFPKHPPFQGLLKPAFISQRQTEEPPNIRDTSGISGNVFAHPQTNSSAPYPQELNSTWRKTIEELIHMSTAEKSGRPERDQDLRCQSGPSAKDSVIFSGGDHSKNYGADHNDCRFRISSLTSSLRQQLLLAGR